MSTYGPILAFCVLLSNNWGSSAFSVKASNALTFKGDKLENTHTLHSLEAVSSGLRDSVYFATQTNSSPKNSDVRSASRGSIVRAERIGTEMWDTLSPEKVQGRSLRTWSFPNPSVERVQVLLKSEGRPLNANIELWQGPDNTPQRMQIYSEDGNERPVNVVIDAPRGSNSVAIRNTSPMEFPLEASVKDDRTGPLTDSVSDMRGLTTVQGGAVRTFPFSPTVETVQVFVNTNGRPLNARIELLQGPNNVKQVIDVYTEDGLDRPFYAVMETPGTGNVVRIVNTATLEYPLAIAVETFRGHSGREKSDRYQSEPFLGESNVNRPSWLN